MDVVVSWDARTHHNGITPKGAYARWSKPMDGSAMENALNSLPALTGLQLGIDASVGRSGRVCYF